jgi:hypothetical protein
VRLRSGGYSEEEKEMSNETSFDRDVTPVGKIPTWAVYAANKYYRLLNLQAYTIYLHYCTLKTANKYMREYGYKAARGERQPLEKDTKAAVHIDPVYLVARIFLISPLKRGIEGENVICHELIHVLLRQFNVRLLAGDDATDVEESQAETILSILSKLPIYER